MRKKTVIRKIEIEDLGKIFNLGQKVFPNVKSVSLQWNKKNIIDIISENMDISFIAINKKEIMGFLIGCINKDDKLQNTVAKIIWFEITGELKNPNIMIDLYNEFKREISSRNIEVIEAEIPDDNTDEIDFFSKIGFTETGKISKLKINL